MSRRLRAVVEENEKAVAGVGCFQGLPSRPRGGAPVAIKPSPIFSLAFAFALPLSPLPLILLLDFVLVTLVFPLHLFHFVVLNPFLPNSLFIIICLPFLFFYLLNLPANPSFSHPSPPLDLPPTPHPRRELSLIKSSNETWRGGGGGGARRKPNEGKLLR